MRVTPSSRFRIRQAGLVLLVLALVVPWTMGSSAEAPHPIAIAIEHAPEFDADGDEELTDVDDDVVVSQSDDTGDSSLYFAIDESSDWITISSDDLTAEVAADRDPAEFFGMVGRDPWYEYGTNPEDHPNDVNRTFLENMVADMADMGVRWVRFEFRAETDVPEGPGPIDWAKHDWFINELLPAHDIQALGLLGSGLVGDEDRSYQFQHINAHPSQIGRNRYTQVFIEHVDQIAQRYGDNIAAYEILNEPNNNQILSWETRGQVEQVDPLIYGRLAIDSYNAIKEHSPGSLVVVGSLLHHYTEGVNQHFEWMGEVYDSTHVQTYRGLNGHYPWDAVSIHPYFLTADGVIDHMNEFREVQLSYDDTSPVWLTEIGLEAHPPAWTSFGIMDPTDSELAQAQFMEEVYTRLAAETPFVERVFWFKYEDFGNPQDSYYGWGLVRLRSSNYQYGPEAAPWPRKLGYLVYQSMARPDMVPTHPVPRPGDEGDRVRYFEQTGQELRDPFLQYWEDHGGLSMFGYPVTRVFEVRGRQVQYFERARFEFWPENTGTQWEVQLGLLGVYETRTRSFERQDPPDDGSHTTSEWVYFPQTGQYLAGAFRSYWESNGGLEIFGYPISPEFDEVNPSDGETYVVQYFERARFEWHPELSGTEYEVQLGLLGNQVLNQPGWRR